MKERPILMSGPLVVQTMKGRKTQTRRVMNPQPVAEVYPCHANGNVYLCEEGTGRTMGCVYADVSAYEGGYETGLPMREFACPYGRPRTRLWVRETWRSWRVTCETDPPFDIENHEHADHCDQTYVAYRATPREGFRPTPDRARITYLDESTPLERNRELLGPWKPSIHMPRAFSRLTLEITAIRAEKLQSITEEDARAEGGEVGPNVATAGAFYESGYRSAFRLLWNDINGKRLVGGKPVDWKSDPWVWVISYRVAELYGRAANA